MTTYVGLIPIGQKKNLCKSVQPACGVKVRGNSVLNCPDFSDLPGGIYYNKGKQS